MSPRDEGRPRRRAQTWAFCLAFLGLFFGNTFGAWLARQSAIENAEPGETPDYALAWFIGIGGGIAIIGLFALLVITLRHQRRLRGANQALADNEVRSRALQEVAGRLARALSSDDVVTALLDHLPATVGAKSAAVAVTTEHEALELIQHDPSADPVLLDPIPGSVISTALAEREPAWLQSPLGWRGDDVADLLADGGWAMAVLPLVGDDLFGLLAVSYPRVHTFVDEERALLETLGVLASRAFARGRRYDSEHRAALAFQRSALPSALPEVDGLTIAARYRPGAQRAAVGGDWYDVLVLDEDRVALLVGDVVGHGMEAAAAMGRLRTGFQMIAPLRPEPGAMVQAVSQQVGAIPNAMCSTVLCAVVDLRAESMQWCRAGHLPPLLLRGRQAELLDEAGVPPLGVSPELAPPVHHLDLQQGDRLALYTDGVIERRSESIDDGFERLRLVGEALADLDPEDLCDALLEAIVPVAEQSDDVAILIVRYDGR